MHEAERPHGDQMKGAKVHTGNLQDFVASKVQCFRAWLEYRDSGKWLGLSTSKLQLPWQELNMSFAWGFVC